MGTGAGSILELSNEGKKPLIIDEFPYMVRNNSSIASVLKTVWDSRLQNEEVMIILCCSAMSFIENEILAGKNLLYGRATAIVRMNAMAFYKAIQFFPNCTNLNKITAYAVLEVIPHYLKQFNQSTSFNENIKQTILQRDSILHSEAKFLMRQVMRGTMVYNTIIEAVALDNTRLGDIFKKTNSIR